MSFPAGCWLRINPAAAAMPFPGRESPSRFHRLASTTGRVDRAPVGVHYPAPRRFGALFRHLRLHAFLDKDFRGLHRAPDSSAEFRARAAILSRRCRGPDEARSLRLLADEYARNRETIRVVRTRRCRGPGNYAITNSWLRHLLDLRLAA